jgi:hypothetical protein
MFEHVWEICAQIPSVPCKLLCMKQPGVSLLQFLGKLPPKPKVHSVLRLEVHTDAHAGGRQLEGTRGEDRIVRS